MGPSYFWRGLTPPDPPLFRTLGCARCRGTSNRLHGGHHTIDGIQPPDRLHVVCDTSATASAQQGPRDIRWICRTAIIDGPPSRRRAGLQILVWTSHQPVSQPMLPSITPNKELCSSPVGRRQENSNQQFCHLQS